MPISSATLPERPLFGWAQAAAVLGITEGGARVQAARGKLSFEPVARIGTVCVFDADQVEAHRDAKAAKGKPAEK